MNVERPFCRLHPLCKLQTNLSEFCLLPTTWIKYIYINHSKVKKLQLSGFHSQYTHSRRTSCMYTSSECPIELLAREQNRIDLAIIRLSKLEPSHTFQLRLERKQIRSSRTSCSSRHKPAFLLHFYILISFMQYLQPSMKAIQLPESTALSFFFLF